MFKIDRNFVTLKSPAEITQVLPLEMIRPSPEAAPREKVARDAPFDREDAAEAAADILKEAKREAALFLNSAQQEAENLRSEAWQLGYSEGRTEAVSALALQKEQGALEIRALLEELARAREKLFERFEGDVVDLSLAVAKKIVGQAIGDEKKLFEGMITGALRQMKREGKILIRVSEAQYDTFFNASSAVYVLGDEKISVSVESDPTLGEYDLILESDGETVNAGVSSQLKYIALAFGRSERDGPL